MLIHWWLIWHQTELICFVGGTSQIIAICTGFCLRIRMIILVGQDDETAWAAKRKNWRFYFFWAQAARMIPGWWCQRTAGAGWCQDDAPSRKFSPHMSQPRQDDARMTTTKKTCGATDWPHYVHINDSVIITISWCKAMKSDEHFEKCENKWNQWDVLKCDRIIWKSRRNTQNLWFFFSKWWKAIEFDGNQ